jgi:hypothetical protein
VKHRASPRFWKAYRRLPSEVRALADRGYALLKADTTHGSLYFKNIGDWQPVRVEAAGEGWLDIQGKVRVQGGPILNGLPNRLIW